MATLIRKGADPAFAEVYRIAQEWKTTSLVDGRSLFDPELAVWTTATIEDLNERIFGEFDKSDRGFVEKLEDELQGASQEAHLLMAEFMFVHLLPLNNVSGEKKRSHIDAIGSWAPQPFSTPERLAPTMELGVFNGGVGFNTLRHAHVQFLMRFARRWADLDLSRRAELLDDPWAFKEFLNGQPLDKANSQLNALLLLLFPDTFEDISSREHKKRIIETYPTLTGDATDIDRQLLAIREAKTADFGTDFSWYEPTIRRYWDTDSVAPQAIDEQNTVSSALEAALANPGSRQTFAKTAAEVILAAHEINEASWSVSFRSRGIHVNVGPNRTLSVSQDHAGVAVTAENRSDLVDELNDAGLDQAVVDDQPYAHPGDVFYVRTPLADLDRLLDFMRDRLIDATVKTAVWNTPHRQAYSDEAVTLLAELSGTELPDPPEQTAASALGRRAWIVRMKRDQHSAVAEGLEAGASKVWWPIDVPAGSNLQTIKAAMRDHDPELSSHAVSNRAGNLHRFITQIQPGDVILMPDGEDLHLGTVVGEAQFDRAAKEWSRPVDWLDAPLSREEVSTALYSRLRSLLTVTDITTLLPELAGHLAEIDEPAASGVDKNVTLPVIDDDFAKRLLLDRNWLEDIVELLRRKKQVIFYGPPGTSKTFVATRLADHLAGAGNCQLVQFHPSYSYEDFVEGFRPKLEDGTLTYELTPGPLKRIAEAARENPGKAHLLIIDEINRGNLAKIFGELYFLLEYREESLSLQYSGTDDAFSLPENLFVIGTMNTADRSIALVDAAIRRRFHFVEFSPNRFPIDGLLRRWLEREELATEPAELLAELNRRLDDDDYAIGPSYLMDHRVDTERGLEQIWNHGILPLLEEHFHGRPDAVARFQLESLRAAIGGPANSASMPTNGSFESTGDTAAPEPVVEAT